jgi:hypothetical protein
MSVMKFMLFCFALPFDRRVPKKGDDEQKIQISRVAFFVLMNLGDNPVIQNNI